MNNRLVPARREPVLVLVVFALAALTGCSKKKNQEPPEEQGTIFKDAGRSGPTDPQHGSYDRRTVERPAKGTSDGTDEGTGGGSESPGKIKREYRGCPKPTPVTSADAATPEGTLYMVFEALLEKDEDTSFKKFYAHVDPDYQRRDDARRYWFKAARKDNGKAFKRLVYGDEDPSFDICSQRPEGKGVRIFVAKSPPVGSNPPFVLHKVGEKWLLKTFTPH